MKMQKSSRSKNSSKRKNAPNKLAWKQKKQPDAKLRKRSEKPKTMNSVKQKPRSVKLKTPSAEKLKNRQSAKLKQLPLR